MEKENYKLFKEKYRINTDVKRESSAVGAVYSTTAVSAYCTLTPKEFLHSSLEALHTKLRQRPQLAKEGNIGGI
jgi:hypothetical protein